MQPTLCQLPSTFSKRNRQPLMTALSYAHATLPMPPTVAVFLPKHRSLASSQSEILMLFSCPLDRPHVANYRPCFPNESLRPHPKGEEFVLCPRDPPYANYLLLCPNEILASHDVLPSAHATHPIAPTVRVLQTKASDSNPRLMIVS